jgi:hypothetical protein
VDARVVGNARVLRIDPMDHFWSHNAPTHSYGLARGRRRWRWNDDLPCFTNPSRDASRDPAGHTVLANDIEGGGVGGEPL